MSGKRFWGIAVFIGLFAAGWAPAQIVKGPWLQNVKENSIVVMWQADEFETLVPTVDYGQTTGYETGTATATNASVNGYPVYTAVISGLLSDTIYHYRVNSGGAQSADATFKTAITAGSTGFRFYALGDNRSNPSTWYAISELVRKDMMEYPEHHQTFVLNSGDLCADGSVYNDWAQYHPPARDMLARLPAYVGFGNHEERNTSTSDNFNYGYFNFPYADSGSTDEKWYSFDYGNIHVAAMDIYDSGGYTSGPQYNWIQTDLQAATADWVFTCMHFTPWSIGNHTESERPNLRTVIHPIFRDNGVICSFGGHNHLYGRYLPVDGVTYITTGGAGAGLHTSSYSEWPGANLATYSGVYHYCIIDVEADAVSVRGIDGGGNRLDYVTFGGTVGNRPPFADAGANVQGTEGVEAFLNGTASEDPEGAGLTYEWTQVSGPPVSLTGPGTAQPSFTPTTTGDYLFQLRVHDGTYWSAPDFCVAAVGGATGGTLTFTAAADTYVSSGAPDSNFGTSTRLQIDADPTIYHSYLRFDVSGVPAAVLNATLRLFCIDAGDAASIYTSSDTTWAENAPTWNSPLPQGGSVIASMPANLTGTWMEADVTSAVAGNGPVTFILIPTGGGGADFDSKEGANAPELVVTYSATIADPMVVSANKPALLAFPNPAGSGHHLPGRTYTGREGGITVRIYNAAGYLVRTLRATQDAFDLRGGLFFDGKAESGRYLPAGAYTYIVQSGTGLQTGKLVITR